MTREKVDSATVEQSISADGSVQLEVNTGRAEEVIVLIDDGTTGGSPASYNLLVDSYNSEVDDYQRLVDSQGSTDTNHKFDSFGENVRVTIEDASSSASNRRVLVKSYRTLD